jgi:hypothetical protein
MPLPPPPDQIDEGGEFAEFPDLFSIDVEGHSQVSQGTDPVASADQDTVPDGLPIRIFRAQHRFFHSVWSQLRSTPPLIWALAVLLPVALATIIGVLIAIVRAMSAP